MTPLELKNKYPDDVELIYNQKNQLLEIKIQNINDEITELNCSYCSELISLPELNNLTKLDCYNCTSLVFLPELNNLTKLDCFCCSKLISLPELNNLTKLDCSFCVNLTSLPDLNNLEKLDCTLCKNLKQRKNNYKTDRVKNILLSWSNQGLVPYSEEKGYLFWKCITPDLKGNMGFQYEIGSEFKNSGMACPGPFGALKDWDRNKIVGSRIMAFYSKCIYPVDIKKGVFHTLQGAPQAVYLATDITKDGFTPTLIMGEEDDNIKKVLYGE